MWLFRAEKYAHKINVISCYWKNVFYKYFFDIYMETSIIANIFIDKNQNHGSINGK